jgi:hypothetical protein
MYVHAEGDIVVEENYNDKMIDNLNAATEWLITEGPYTYSLFGKQGIHRKLVDEWGVLLWVDPWTENERYIDGFWIKARGVYHDVINLYREEYNGELYEFWFVKVRGQDWAEFEPKIEFYITKTIDINGRRKVVEKSDQYIDSIKLGDEKIISFPADDLKVLYELQAWLYPSGFRFSDLSNNEIIIDDNGHYKMK